MEIPEKKNKTKQNKKNIYFFFIDYPDAFHCVAYNKMRKILKAMVLPGDLICLLRKLRADQEAAARTGHGITDCFRTGKRVHQGCLLSPCLFNFYTEYIWQNTRLDESQAGIRTVRRNIDNLRYADDTTLIAEIKEKLKSLLMTVKEESEKSGLKHNIQETKILASSLISPWQVDGGKVERVTDFLFLGSRITVDGDCSHEIKRCLLLGRKSMTNLDSILRSRDIACCNLFFLISNFVDLIFSLFFLLSLAKGLSILFIFSKNQLLVLLIFTLAF